MEVEVELCLFKLLDHHRLAPSYSYANSVMCLYKLDINFMFETLVVVAFLAPLKM